MIRLSEKVYDSLQKETVTRKLGIFQADKTYYSTLDMYYELYGHEDIDLIKYYKLYWQEHDKAEFSSEYKYYLEGATDPNDVHILVPLDYYIEGSK